MSVLENLAKDLQKRFPNVLPKGDTSIDKIQKLQGNQEVVDYILSYLHANEQEIKRESILKGR